MIGPCGTDVVIVAVGGIPVIGPCVIGGFEGLPVGDDDGGFELGGC